MEILIISNEIIKPSSPTPHHLKTHKLSAVDLFIPPLNLPVILFYSPAHDVSSKVLSDNLKRSFSKTLAKFYPFAGRMKDGGSAIDCNDDGATYIEAHVKCNMSMILQQPDIHQLEQLQPCKSDGTEGLHELSTRDDMLKVQVNYFDCGGIAICVCVNHRIADGPSLASFVKCWGAISCGLDNKNFDGVVIDCTSLFQPPKVFSAISVSDLMCSADRVVKRFVFDGPKIAALRGKLSNRPYLDRPTRVEAVSGLIWGAFVGEENESRKENNIAFHTINLRKRLDPPLPQHCIGNIFHIALADWPAKEVDYNGLAGKIHESISMINNDYVKQVYADNAYFDLVRGRMADMAKDPANWSLVGFTSWCKFPYYEIDFGWGKPIWVGTATREVFNNATLLDARDGEGIEAWVTLSKEDMVKFENNPDILAYASFTLTI